MCILIQQPKGHTFSNAWLQDFFRSNADGIGVMYAQHGQLIVKKLVPQNVEELINFYRQNIQGKECFIHFRMRTHGDINLEQCHPYEIFGQDTDYPLYLMHNGVLSTGNAEDTTKSDTWHYIKNIIRPALQADPSQFTVPWFKKLIESHIGHGNKFAIVDKHGNSAIFNKSSGVMWGDVWMSNTYAWDAAAAGVIKSYKNFGSYGSGYTRFDAWDEYPTSTKRVSAPVNTVVPIKRTKEDVQAAWDEIDADEYVIELRRQFNRMQWFEANKTITNAEIKELYKSFGYSDAYMLVDLVIDSEVDEEDVMHLFQKFKDDPVGTTVDAVFEFYTPAGHSQAEDDDDTQASLHGMTDEEFAAVMGAQGVYNLFD